MKREDYVELIRRKTPAIFEDDTVPGELVPGEKYRLLPFKTEEGYDIVWAGGSIGDEVTIDAGGWWDDGNGEKMLAFIDNHPNATYFEICEYEDSIAPSIEWDDDDDDEWDDDD